MQPMPKHQFFKRESDRPGFDISEISLCNNKAKFTALKLKFVPSGNPLYTGLSSSVPKIKDSKILN